MNIYQIIKSNDLKLFSPFIEGGITKLKKAEKDNLNNILQKYDKSDKDFYFEDIKITLDDEQYSIVTANPNQNIRILAGAGSGKTTTILCRVKYLVDNHITPNRILILTFNKDASENLKNRIIKLFVFKINIDIYTIDAFCCMLYHKYEDNKSFISLSEYILLGRKIMFEYGKEISAKYKYVFFDEFQDVNSKQFDILNEFVKNGCFLTVIGDDSQNIYQFRGTDNYYMINFDNIFENTSTFTLTTNYRSTQEIVNLANNCISFNQNQVKKVMKTSKQNVENKIFLPRFILSKTEDHQIDYIIDKITSYTEKGINLGEIAILSRNSYHLKIMEGELLKHNIPMVSCITDKIGENIKKVLEPNKVTVTTIHKSKGLEWSKVFILGFCHQHFPSQMNNNIKNIEEERRLFYVGATRAKKSLFLMATSSEVPISIFIKENKDFMKFIYNPKNSKPTIDIFNIKDDNMIKQEYSVNDLVLLLNTENIDEMRKKGFIPDLNLDVSNLFINLDLDISEKIEFNKEIKEGSYEPDFGEFVDRYITRDIMITTNKEFKDNDTMMILNATILSNEEMEVYNKFKVNNLKDDEDAILLDILNRIKMKKNKFQKVIKENTYPFHFLKKLKDSYKIATSTKPSGEILNDVYFVSLCRNFNYDRRRLVYRNIFNLFENMLDKGIRKNMDKYVEQKINNDIICKKTIYHKYKDTATILGEIDIIDWTEETLIDIKCSESEYKLEWYLQLLFYYSFLNNQEKEKIKYLGVANIMDGKYYKVEIPQINYDEFIKYIEVMIKRDQNNIRICNNPLIINTSKYEPKDIIVKKIICKKNPNKNLVMILDTETSSFYNDVLQLAYVLCDKNGKLVKEINYYVKNRLPSIDTIKIHGINKAKINELGIDFDLIIEELINDLSKSEIIVGHNLQYDLTSIQNDIRTYGVNIVDENDKIKMNIFDDVKITDTITLTKKKIKLEELYYQLFNKKIQGAHNALNDVLATKECYFKLLSQT